MPYPLLTERARRVADIFHAGVHVALSFADRADLSLVMSSLCLAGEREAALVDGVISWELAAPELHEALAIISAQGAVVGVCIFLPSSVPSF